jgi:hypothetical protein
MASSGNFAVFSTVTRPESPYSTSDQITGGGLSIKGPGSGGFEPCIATISPNSGKWYWEYRAGQGGGSSYGRPSIAVSEQGVVKNEEFFGGASGQKGVLFVANDGQKRINGSDTSYGNAVSQHDIVQMALDCDNGAMYFGINNTWQNSGDPTSGSSKTGAALTADIQNVGIDIIHSRYVGGGIDQYNFGQDDTFGGAITGAGNADGNGHGVFKYAPPTGFLALCTGNLSVSDDIDPAQTDDDYPSKQFNTVLYAGNNGAQSVTGVGFKPDLVWLKARNGTQHHALFDSSRGVLKRLGSSRTNAEDTDSTFLSSFDTDGFSWSSGGDNTQNDNSYNYVAWCWRANGGTTASNSEGSTTCTVQANTKGGFSMITYTGTGSAATLGHGLEKAPEFIMAKRRSSAAQSWKNYHVGLGATKYLTLNATDAAATSSGMWNDTAPSTTLISIGNESNVSTSGSDYIIYAWHSVEGYSKFGIYEGNGNADGPFIYMGFRPRMVVIKAIDSSQSWYVADTARETFNPLGEKMLSWNDSHAEFDPSGFNFDVVSNGIKIRSSDTNINSSATFIYMAWGDVPFKYNNTF